MLASTCSKCAWFIPEIAMECVTVSSSTQWYCLQTLKQSLYFSSTNSGIIQIHWSMPYLSNSHWYYFCLSNGASGPLIAVKKWYSV